MTISATLLNGLETIGEAWFDVKIRIETSVDFSHDALHVLFGVCLQLVFAALLRTSIARIRPFLLVLFLGLANELNDFRAEGWTFLDVQLAEARRDTLLTIALPLILLLATRFIPSLFGATAPKAKSLDDAAPIAKDSTIEQGAGTPG